MDTETTNPVDGGDTSVEDTAPEGQEVDSQADETLYDDNGNPIEPEPEVEEIERDGKKYQIPKALAPELLMQADYTRKTQELAEQRRSFEAERMNVHQSTQQELNAYAQVTQIQQQLAAYQQVDWNAWNDQDPFDAQKGFMHFQQLKDAHQGAMNQLQGLTRQRMYTAQQETARRVHEGRNVLSQEIGWNDELKTKLEGYALGAGLSRDDLSDLEASPAAAKILHAAYQWHQHSQKTQAANKHLAAQQAQPAAKVGAKAAPPSGVDDRLSTDEWMRRRNAQVRKRA
jgi:hypothetical protein